MSEPETLDEWWESEPDVDLIRSEWSVLLETVSEMVEMDRCGDHVDRMTGRERQKIIANVREQADIEPPIELTRKQYQESKDERGEA